MSNPPDQRESLQANRKGIGHRLLYSAGVLLVAYLAMAYFLLPLMWRTETRRHRADLTNGPRITHTANGIPGDPINVALVGSQTDVIHAMLEAKWFPADPITFDTSIRIAVDSVFRKPDDEAPVSSLFLFGRKQDLAFEQPVGDSPRQRHHVRFWRWDKESDGREVWFGSVTFDERVGLSHTTGQITHHIGPDVDAERDRLISELQKANQAQEVYWVAGFHKELSGKNGGGDSWQTDGRLEVAVLGLRTNLPAARP
ncbi:MAG TPA: LssY C-terminal domain-containing protein [Verrucomicrobiae bacterium]|nr:LssY C-terminal domain-containing protein [Verrucomicrobiae bacterium]